LGDIWRGPHGRPSIAALGTLFVLLFGGWQVSQWYGALLLSESKAQAAVRASLRGNALSLALERRLALLQGLHAYVQAEAGTPDLQSRFEIFAAQLYDSPSSRGVRNIALAPNSIVCCVYPLAGNEAVIGYQPMSDPRPIVREDVGRAIASGEMVLSGPIALVQGGMGLIARQAIYLPSGENQADVYWGLVNVVLDLSSLLDEVDLDVQTDVTLDYALRDGAGNVIYGDKALFDQDPVVHLVSLPEGVWELVGVPNGGWQQAIRRPLRIFQFAWLMIALLMAGLAYLSVRRQVELAQAYIKQKAITEQNIRLHEQEQQLAILEERQRIARELHDSVSQALYGIGLGARTASALLDREPSKATEPLNYVLSLAEGGLAEMRALILELRPDSLEREGLVSALNKQAAALRARYDLEVETDLGQEPDLTLGAKESLYRITQETLNNIIKHAQAKRVEIRLRQYRDRTVLTVRDDGVGFDLEQDYPGIGLHTMAERTAQMGGTFYIDSEIGRGTRIRVVVPMPNNESAGYSAITL
jgi:signal transduction histidine kinase